MERAEARRVLGVDESATPEQVRAAYRRLVRAHHPDVAGPHQTRRTADLTVAYRALREPDDAPAPAPDSAPPPPDEPPPATRVPVARVDDNSFAIGLPSDEAFLRMLDLGHSLGEVTYVDPEAGLLETIVRFDDGSTCSAVFTTQGRADGTTEVFCTLARLSPRRATGPAPVAAIVVDAVIAALGEETVAG